MLPPLHTLQPAATRHWSKADPVMARLSRAHPLDPDPAIAAPDAFAALVRAVAHQQVSMAAGTAIHGRLIRTLGGAVTPRRVLARPPQQLREAGLSQAKVASVLDLAAKAKAGLVRLDDFDALPDEEIVRELVAVKGIGPWTAKMFLIFHLHRPDVVAPEDLGLRLAVADAYGVQPDLAAAAMLERSRLWSPYNSVAARVLWQSRRAPVA